MRNSNYSQSKHLSKFIVLENLNERFCNWLFYNLSRNFFYVVNHSNLVVVFEGNNMEMHLLQNFPKLCYNMEWFITNISKLSHGINNVYRCVQFFFKWLNLIQTHLVITIWLVCVFFGHGLLYKRFLWITHVSFIYLWYFQSSKIRFYG